MNGQLLEVVFLGYLLRKYFAGRVTTPILIEKNESLASETSKVFHEWLHSGALYSLVPDNLLTLRYLLGATDDLFEFYGSFSRMNLITLRKWCKFKNTQIPVGSITKI